MVRVHTLLLRIMNFPKISIAAINGFALGGGLEFAMACTFRVARASAKLGQPEIKLGLIPAYAGSQTLPRLVGESRAMEILLTGEPFDAATAQAIGLVNRVSPDSEDVVDAACALADQCTRFSAVTTAAMRRAVREGMTLPLEQAFAHERAVVKELCNSEDSVEGVKAFLEKRPAVWKDR
jgi:enoyl-CoA hydratase/carnithine racemase